MRTVHRDLKRGRIKLLSETLDDLWHLQHLIEPGDLVISSTLRRPKSETNKIRPERREKERVKISLRVEKVEFHKYSNRLRVLGEIERGPDRGEHHTINLDTDSKFTVVKDWKSDHLQRLREAERASKRPRMLLLALDDESATFGLVRQYGLEELGRIDSRTSGKLYESDRKSERSRFYRKICSMMKNHMKMKNTESAIIAGPGFAKKDLHLMLKEKFPEIASKTHLGNTSAAGKSGLNEIIRRGIVKRVSQNDRISYETELVEKMMGEIAEDGLAVYGREEVEDAIDFGAVDRLLVADELLRKERDKVEPMLDRTRDVGGQIVILSTEHEGGKRLSKLGGIGALLRFCPF